jgi:hypothetical protein
MYHVHMGHLNRRVHVLLDDDRLRRLQERAATSGSSVGALIRSAIDRELESAADSAAVAALESFLAAPSFPIGTPEEIDRELEETYEREHPRID